MNGLCTGEDNCLCDRGFEGKDCNKTAKLGKKIKHESSSVSSRMIMPSNSCQILVVVICNKSDLLCGSISGFCGFNGCGVYGRCLNNDTCECALGHFGDVCSKRCKDSFTYR